MESISSTAASRGVAPPYWGPPGGPYQGLILPEAAGPEQMGKWRFDGEYDLWKKFGVTRTCPPA